MPDKLQKDNSLIDAIMLKFAATQPRIPKGQSTGGQFAPSEGGGTGGGVSSEQARYDKAKSNLDNIEKKIGDNKAPFEGEITGGNVQMAAVGQWRQSRRGQAWNRRDDALRQELTKAKEELDAAKFALDKKQSTAAAGGKTIKKLITALSWTKTPSIPSGMSFEGYRKAYNAAKKNGDDLSSYPTPDDMKKSLGLKEYTDNSLFIFKQSNGQSRWVTFSSNAYRDRDKEIVSTKALEADCARADKEGDYGPLRWWHVGKPDPFAKLPGAGADIGACDYNAMHGRILVESGTFGNERIAEAIKSKAQELQVSIGYFHPLTEPDSEGVFHTIRRFERSLLPKGRASNPWTSMLVVQKEGENMLAEKIKALKLLLGGDDELVQTILDSAEKAEKQAIESGVAFKEDEQSEPDPTPEAPAQPAAEVVEAKAEDEAESESQSETEEVEEMEPVIGDMSPDEFAGMLAEAMGKALEPYQAEVKALKASMSKKDDSEASLREALEAQAAKITQLSSQVSELIGEQPRAATKAYRASQDEATVIKQDSTVKGKAPTVDPAFRDFAIGK